MKIDVKSKGLTLSGDAKFEGKLDISVSLSAPSATLQSVSGATLNYGGGKLGKLTAGGGSGSGSGGGSGSGSEEDDKVRVDGFEVLHKGNLPSPTLSVELTGDVTGNGAVTFDHLGNASLIIDTKSLSGSGVTSFNGRTGAVSLTSNDVVDALGFLPSANAATAETANNSLNLGGQTPAFYLNLANSTGTLPAARLSGTYNININGNANTATTAASAAYAEEANTASWALNSSNAVYANSAGYTTTANNANYAGRLSTARVFTLSGDVTGNVAFDGSSNVVIQTVVSDTDLVRTSTTNLGKTGNGGIDTGDKDAAWWGALPTGYTKMTNFTTANTGAPTNGFGYVFKMARRDNSNGGYYLYGQHSTGSATAPRFWIGKSSDASTYPNWAEVYHTGNFTPTLYARLNQSVEFSGVSVSGPVGSSRTLFFNSGSSTRWALDVQGSVESGSNVGSELTVNRYNDAGTYIDTVLSISRSSGVAHFAHRPLVNGNEIWDKGNLDLTNVVFTNVENRFTGVQRFTAVGRPGLEIWDTATYDGNAVRFGPQGGISFATGGVWQTGSFANLKNALYNDRAGSLPKLTIAGASGTYRELQFDSGSAPRWNLNVSDQAESGSNVGSNLALNRYTDSGAYLGTVFNISRATGVVDFMQTPTVNGNPIGGGSDPDAVKVSTTGLGMDTPQGLYAGVIDQAGLRALPTGYTGTVGVSSPAMPTTLSGSLFKIGTRGGTSATRGATYLHIPLASAGAAPRVWFGQAPNDSVDVAWTEVWTASTFNPGSYGALGNSQTWTGSNVFSGAVPVRANGNHSGSGFVDLASINTSSTAGIVFRGSDAGRWGYIDASSTTLRINADVANIALNRRPTFAGNLAWDAGNLNPSSFISASTTNQFTDAQNFTAVPGSGGQIRLKTNTGTAEYGIIHRMDNSNYYILVTNNNDADGVWNGLRPFRINLPNGAVTMDNGVTVGGGLNVASGTFTYGGNVFSQNTTNNSFVQRDGAGWVYGTGMRTETGNGNGLRLWGGNASFSVYMSSAGDATWGGRVAGETTSDYNIYFRNGSGGTNRGFNFKIDSTVVAGIDASGTIRANGGVIAPDLYADNWFRAKGSGGLYWEAYGGGWNMSDTVWVRSYNGKNVYTAGEMRAGTGFTIADASIGFGGDRAKGFYTDPTNVAIRATSASGSIFFQNASGTKNYAIFGDGTLDMYRPVSMNGNRLDFINNRGLNNGIRFASESSADMRILHKAANVIHITNESAGYETFSFTSAGALWARDSVTAPNVIGTSDESLKHNITDLENVDDLVARVKAVRFKWKADDTDAIGFIAQQMEPLFPELVHTDGNGVKGFNYQAMTAVLVRALQSTNAKIDSIEERLAKAGL